MSTAMQVDEPEPTHSQTREELRTLRAYFKDLKIAPYCTGTVPLDVNSATLFYRSSHSDSKAGLINFYNPTDAQLENLANACEPATFGMNQLDVYDESYRKAGKLDVGRFSTQFQPVSPHVIEVLRDVLLGSRVDPRSIHAELYKLNVYGPGGFFKAHVDTPRGYNMFGSLVVILPTVHEGGSLILRKGGKEWIFDSAQAVKHVEVGPSKSSDASESQSNETPEGPHAAYIAFFGDVEHEVTTVSSGYRVTLTYNLYCNIEPILERPSGHNVIEAKIKESIDDLLKNPSFFPDGGYLGFGLGHRYVVDPKTTKLKDIQKQLKANDEMIKRVCESLSLNVSLRALYRLPDEDEDDGKAVLFSRFPSFAGFMTEYEDKWDYLQNAFGKLVRIPKAKEMSELAEERHTDNPLLVWVKPLQETNSFSDDCMYYDYEPSQYDLVGEVCLVAKVDSVKERLRI